MPETPPQIWVGAHSTPSCEYAARHNYQIAQGIDVNSVIAEQLGLYRRLWVEHKHAGTMPRSFLTRHVYVAETDEQARAEAEPNLLMGYTQTGDGISKALIGWEAKWDSAADERTVERQEIGRVFREPFRSYYFWADMGLALVGSPETVIRKIEQQHRLMEYDVLRVRTRFGRLVTGLSYRPMRLFAQHVISTFA